MSVLVQEQLRTFATTLLERRGALVEWPAAERLGSAILPPEVAETLGVSGDVVPLACDASPAGLSANLAGDFLQWAGRLLEAEPRIGAFRVRELYLKRKELEEGIGRTFTWLNAKVRIRDARQTAVEYHTWWFHGAISSEDRWETCFRFSLNSASGAEIDFPDPLGLWELEPRPSPPRTASSYPRAVAVARRRLLRLAGAFLERMDSRLQRDRKRLHDYYHALLRETDKKKTRTHSPPEPEKIEAAKRAVNLELRRKLGELDERYAMEAALRPAILIRTEVPVLAVDLSVFRKQAHRIYTVYWNPLVKRFEPLSCGRCGEGAFAMAFTNDNVESICQKCSG